MALLRAVRLTHQTRIRRMLRHYVSARQRVLQAAQLATVMPPDGASASGSSSAFDAWLAEANAAATSTGQQASDAAGAEAPRRRGRGRRRRLRSVHLTADQVADAVVADETAQASGRASLGLAELLESLGDDGLPTTTAAQTRAVRRVLRRRRRGQLSAASGVAMRPDKPVNGHAFRAPSRRRRDNSDGEDDGRPIDHVAVSPSHPYMAKLPEGAGYGLESQLPLPYYAFGRQAAAAPSAAKRSSIAGPPDPCPRKKAARASATGNDAQPDAQQYRVEDPKTAKAAQRAAARHQFFVAGFQQRPEEELFPHTMLRLRTEWRSMSSRQKAAFIPEAARRSTVSAPEAGPTQSGTAMRSTTDTAVVGAPATPGTAPHITLDDDDCAVVPPPRSMEVHVMDRSAAAAPHHLPLMPRSHPARLVRSAFQLFVDAHIDTARADLEEPAERARSAGGSSSPATKPVATVSPVGASHALTVAAVDSLAEAWMELKAQDRRAYASLAEGFTTTSRRYFDDAYDQLRRIHRTTPGAPDRVESETAADAVFSEWETPERPHGTDSGAVRHGARVGAAGLAEVLSAGTGQAWSRLPLSPVVRRRQAERLMRNGIGLDDAEA